MPYFVCPRCGARSYGAAANQLEDACPNCGEMLDERHMERDGGGQADRSESRRARRADND